MTRLAQHLTELRRHEQEIHGYSTSSHWYTSLSDAISLLGSAETSSSPIDRLRAIWASGYNLFRLYGKRGDEDSKRFNAWVTDLKDAPDIRRHLCGASGEIALADFRDKTHKARKSILTAQGQQELDAWKAKSGDPDTTCGCLMAIARDIHNTISHPNFNPNTTTIKDAVGAAADCLHPVVGAAIRAMIERPVNGTTRRAVAYRPFLWPFLKNSDSFFADYYLERSFPNEELTTVPEEDATEALRQVAQKHKLLPSKLIGADREANREYWLEPVLYRALGLVTQQGIRVVTADQVFEPSCVVSQSDTLKSEYQGRDAGKHIACMVWELPYGVSLDAVSTNEDLADLTVVEVAHRALTGSDVPWAILANGRQFRLLGRHASHKPRCFLEIDLDATLDRVGSPESLLAFRYWLGLFSGTSITECDHDGQTRLMRVRTGSERQGKETGDELKQNVYRALEELGEGFLAYLRKHEDERESWREEYAPDCPKTKYLHSDELLTDIYHESLYLMYRLLFLFYAESRNLLPMDDELYRQKHSLECIRDDIISVSDDPDPTRLFADGTYTLWGRLSELFRFVNTGWRNLIPAYGGSLFDPGRHRFLECCKVDDYHLARAIDLLSRTQPQREQVRREGRKKVTYRDLDVRHLGTIYEGLLDFTVRIVEEDQAVLRRGSGKKPLEEYKTVTQLSATERQQLKRWQHAEAQSEETSHLPRGCKVVGFKPNGRFFLVAGGKDSKRKSSGAYYTPEAIVQYIIDNTIGRLVADARPPLTSDQILGLRILDPAMGSGHFLVAATDLLARAYAEALIREGKDHDGRIGDGEFTRYKRIVAERCIYGVDINPMAVELAKVSLWLATMSRGLPLSFLDHNLICGDSLIGPPLDELGTRPEVSRTTAQRQKAMLMGLDADDSSDQLALDAAHWELAFPNVFFADDGHKRTDAGFDVVVGNPPYVSFGLRDVGKMSQKEQAFFRARYSGSAQYKISLYAMFIERGLELTKRNGFCSFVLPDSFLLGKYFESLRETTLKQGERLHEIVMFATSFWPEGEVGCPVVLITRNRAGSDGRVSLTFARDLESFRASTNTYTYHAPRSLYRRTPLSRLYFFLSDAEVQLYECVNRDPVTMDRAVKFYSGLIAKAGQKTIVLDEEQARRQTGKISRLVESGRLLRPFHITWNGKYMVHRRELYKSGYTPEFYEQPKILLNQTGDSPKACVDESKLYCLNNMHIGYPLGDPAILYVVAGILNSAFGNVYYRLITMEGGRAMAQIDIDVMDGFPLPREALTITSREIAWSGNEEELHPRRATAQIGAISKYLHDHFAKLSTQERDRWQRRLNNAVLSTYGIDSDVFEITSRRVLRPFHTDVWSCASGRASQDARHLGTQ